MIPLLNKLPKTPDRPPIRYNIKTEYITEELNNTFESYVYRGRPTSGSWNNPSWNGILRTNNQAIENNPIYIKIIRNLVDNSATIIFRVSKKSLIENFKILVNNKEVDISNRKEIGNDYYEYQIFKYNDGAKIDFTRINDLVAYTARLGRWKTMPFGIHLKNMNIQRKKKLEQLWEIRQYQNTENMPLAAKVNNNLYPLSYEVEEEAEITFLDITDNDGRRIYMTSLTFLFTRAAREILDGAIVIVKHSLQNGIYFDIKYKETLKSTHVRLIEKRMRQLVEENVLIERISYTREEAIKRLQED